MINFFTDRIRLVFFGIVVIFLGLISPSKTLQSVHKVLDRYVD